MARVGQRKGQRTAEEAFLDYVSIDRKERSLRLLAEIYVERGYYKKPGTALAVLNRWSAQHRWQERIRQAATEAAERKLQEAADLDADTFLRTSRELNKRAEYADALQMDQMIRMRETVRKPTPKGGTAVSVKVSVEVRQLAEQIAEQLGITADELIADAEEVARNAWERTGSHP